MSRVLVLFAHPGQRHSRINLAMTQVARGVAGITFVDLYAEYPTFGIDIDAEQRRLLDHDVIVFQFPLFWYSTPSVLKEWQDLVLEYGFAYGPGGTRLHGKRLLPVVTTGGEREVYEIGLQDAVDIRTLLSPLQRTAKVCGMTYVPPFVLFGALTANRNGMAFHHLEAYRRLPEALRDDDLDLDVALDRRILNDEIPTLGGAAR
jgi:glutathione-regulated potassium-efflux system ancillary protein KefG